MAAPGYLISAKLRRCVRDLVPSRATRGRAGTFAAVALVSNGGFSFPLAKQARSLRWPLRAGPLIQRNTCPNSQFQKGTQRRKIYGHERAQPRLKPPSDAIAQSRSRGLRQDCRVGFFDRAGRGGRLLLLESGRRLVFGVSRPTATRRRAAIDPSGYIRGLDYSFSPKLKRSPRTACRCRDFPRDQIRRAHPLDPSQAH